LLYYFSKMEELKTLMKRRLKATSTAFVRYLYEEIDWAQRLVLLIGARGSGKTTLLLQRINLMDLPEGEVLYISMDDPFFELKELFRFAGEFHDGGGRWLFVDEVHRYQHWSRDLKWIYDNLPGLNVVVSGSSALDILKGESDLSRRGVVYHLPGLSFREFLSLKGGHSFDPVVLDDLLANHTEISTGITDKIEVLPLFRQYLEYGYYPFFTEGIQVYRERLKAVVNLVLDSDVPALFAMDYHTVRHARKLMYILSESVPFKPNISAISRKTEIHRNTVLRLIDVLDAANLLQAVRAGTKGMSYLAKPEKLYLENTNLMYAFAHGKVNTGQLRETFFLNQVKVKHDVALPKHGDFLLDGRFIFEVGGPSKGLQQIKGVPEAYLAIDGLEGGAGTRIPLWLFGFLY
jgi:uncharacterized protein